MIARDEVLNEYRKEYKKAKKKRKGEILDIVCSATGLSRDRAARKLSSVARQTKTKKKSQNRSKDKRGRKRTYGSDVADALICVWAFMDLVCGKRLHEGINDMLDSLLRFGEISYSDDVIGKLRTMSAATMDRLLKYEKERRRLKGISTTKPGTLLKKNIPIRLGQEWDDAVAGFVEIDLVAHCGVTTAGEYINSLNVTDICTGWTEPVAVLNKAQKWVFEGLMDVANRAPYELKGVDSDNGSEFINNHLYQYCMNNNIVFTRGRSYHKNDGCHIEQKNWSLVRRHIGYLRYEGSDALNLMNKYYALLRLQVNYFLPSTKLLSKVRNGAKVKKEYEIPKTPYKRVLADEAISDEVKERLMAEFKTINPAKISRDMLCIKEELEALCIQE
jgi:hypothetical protein